ncbi:tail fibers protein [Pseudomonas phage PHB09]|uniref:Tail fibers protein n=1 Tax=Pseudomonas phage PHB09 TaxID=2867265 RepID=A0AAE9BMQ9_9CAUD|nr:tail fibers protein [Pseudomonas phage PHB09]UAV84553.1 tail fibers protein [Pseudomonas phage PHB09]
MDLIKYDMTNIWAVAGDVVAPDDAKIRQGWGVEVVPRQWWNWFENRQDNNLAYILQKGIPEWDATTEYIINKSYVQRNGVVYKATATSTNSDPVNLLSWVKAFGDYSIANEALGALTPAADRIPYFTGSKAAAVTPFSAFARSVLAATSAEDTRSVIGAQLQNQNLTSFSAVSPVVNGLPYFTSTTAMGMATLTAFGRSVVSSADAAAGRAVLGLATGSISDIQTSTSDTTTGRLVRVGGFGWGVGANGMAAMDPPSNDFNLATTAGVYKVSTGNLNVPNGYGQGALVLTMMWNNATGSQFIIQNGNSAMRGGTNLNTTPVWTGWAGVWNSNSLTKTSSSSDTTAGRMLQVGDFGLGNQGVLVGNLNSLSNTGTGFYRLGTPYTGSPLTNTAVTCIHQSYDNERTQIAFQEGASTVRQFARKYSGGAWTPWVEFYHSGNSTDLVNQVQAGVQPQLDAKLAKSGGTMTGELIFDNGSADSAGITIRTPSWVGSLDILNDDIRILNVPRSGGTVQPALNISMTNQTISVYGNPVWHSGNFNPNLKANVGSTLASYGIQDAYTVTQSNNIRAASEASMTALMNDGHLLKNGVSQTTGATKFTSGGVPTISSATDSYSNVTPFLVGNGGNNGASAVMAFIRDGSFGTYFGLDTDNNLAWGGWSHGNVRYQIWSQKNFNPDSYVSKGELPGLVNSVVSATGGVGSYAFLLNQSGSILNPGDNIAGSSLRYSSTSLQVGTTPGGNWRCMGQASNGQATLFERYA